MPRGRLAVALGAGAAIVLTAPVIGQIRSALQAALPAGAFRLVIGLVVFGAIACAILVALARIRERRLLRYGLMTLGLVIGVGYAWATRTGNAGVDAVERFHFVEYGALTLLFYRVWRPLEDRATLAAPVLATFIVATLDEGMQWFVPLRVGEIRDVLLNGVAILCGLLFALGLDPPARVSPRFAAGSLGTRLLPAAAFLAVASFVDVIHLGYELQADDVTFRSRFTAAALDHLAATRGAEWSSSGPPVVVRRFSREDQYLAEGLWHVQRRNEAAAEGDLAQAWSENVVLERFFVPVLDHPSYAAPSTSRWADVQRTDMQTRSAGMPRTFHSTAEPFPIVVWNRTVYRVVIALGTVAGVLWVGVGGKRR